MKKINNFKILLLSALVCLSFTVAAPKKIKVYLVGDSTMCLYPANRAPLTGWGMPFANYFDQSVTIENVARGGRSTRTFIAENRWQAVVDSLHAGDYVLIQFGHNDEANQPQYADRYTPLPDFKANLAKFITEARSKQAIPVLITPVTKISFDKDGKAKETHVEYSKGVIDVGAEYKTPVIDLDRKSRELIQQLGPKAAIMLYMTLDAGEHPNYPTTYRDNTHFNDFGARKMAEIVLNGLKEQHIELADRIVKGFGAPIVNPQVR